MSSILEYIISDGLFAVVTNKTTHQQTLSVFVEICQSDCGIYLLGDGHSKHLINNHANWELFVFWRDKIKWDEVSVW